MKLHRLDNTRVWLPEWTPSDADIDKLAARLQHVQPQHIANAKATMDRALRDIPDRAALRLVRDHVRYWREKYETAYGSLDGFDPELVASAWTPGFKASRRGNRPMQALLRRMRG